MDGYTLLVVTIALLTLIGLLLIAVPVAFSLSASGIVGLLLLVGGDVTSSTIAGTAYSAVGQGTLIVVPMFILMGMLTLHSGIAEQLFAIVSKVLRKVPGSLGMSSVFASAGFGAISGSSLATVATLGRTCITEMMRHGYKRSFAAATVAVSGTLAVLIPPSIILVLYGASTGESIGSLLIAGIIPGILSAVMLAGMVSLSSVLRPSLVNQENENELRMALAQTGVSSTSGHNTDSASASTDTSSPSDLREVALTPSSVTRALLGVAAIFTIVIGGIYSGVFTPTESAAVGAIAAFVLIILQYATRPKVLRANLTTALKETASLNAMIFLILVGAGIFSFFLVTAGVPSALSELVVGLPVSPTLIVLLLLLILVPAGMFLEPISLLVITVPLVYQPITDLGFDGIWLGIMIVKLIELGMITPPIGMNAYVAAGTTNGLEVDEVFKGITPFYVAEISIVAVLFSFPSIVTWLPELSAA